MLPLLEMHNHLTAMIDGISRAETIFWKNTGLVNCTIGIAIPPLRAPAAIIDIGGRDRCTF